MDSILQKGPASYDEMQGGIWVPGTSDVVLVPGETVPLTDVVMAGDPNLVPENIRLNATIFGVEGTWNKFQSEDGFYLKGENHMVDITGDYAAYVDHSQGNGYRPSKSPVAGFKEYGLYLAGYNTTGWYNDNDGNQWHSVVGYGTYYVTKNMIDLSNIRSISAKIKTGFKGWSGSGYSTSGFGRLFITAATPKDFGLWGTMASQVQFGTVDGVVSMNVANITGRYYIGIMAGSNAYGPDKMWGVPMGQYNQELEVYQLLYETMPTI